MMTLAAFLRGSQELSISGTTSLVPQGPYVNIVSATAAGLRVRLPDATKLRLGRAQRWISNNGANSFTVRDGANADLIALAPGECADFHLVAQASAAGTWKWELRTVGSAASPGLALLGYLIGGGNSSSPTQSAKTTEWNPQFNVFTAKTDSPNTWVYAASFVIGAHGYIMDPNSNNGKLEQYDPDVHTAKADLLAAIKADGAGEACTISGLGYYTAGQGGTSGGGHVGQYTEGSDSWAQMADRASTQRCGSAGWVTLTAGTAVCFGSWGSSSSQVTPSNRTDLYTAAGDSWAQKTTRPGPESMRFGNTSLNGIGFTFGGDGGTVGTIISDTYEYDQSGDAWTQRPDYPIGKRTFMTAVPIVNQAYVMGGKSTTTNSSSGSVENYQYDPTSASWTQFLDLPHDRGGWQNHGMAVAV